MGRNGGFVEEELTKISRSGERLGHNLRSGVAKFRRVLIVAGALTVVGLLVFLWSVIMGYRRKDGP